MIPAYVWPQLAFLVFAPLLAARRVPPSAQALLPLILALPLAAYQGTFSDWSTYRQFVEVCQAPGCTYFEPLFDAVIYQSARGPGFVLIELLLAAALFASFLGLRMAFPAVHPAVTLISLFSAYFVLYLGAIRQALAGALFLLALGMFAQRQRMSATLVALLSGALHLSGLAAALFLWSGTAVARLRRFGPTGLLLIVLAATLGAFLLLTWMAEFVPRLGQTDVGTAYTFADALGARDALVAAERLVFFLLAIRIFFREKNDMSASLLGLAALAFVIFFSLATIDRNIAGRTIAFLRIADVILLWLALPASHTLRIAALAGYVGVKSHFTFATSGFYDE